MALAALIGLITIATLALAATGRWWLPPGISQHAAAFDSTLRGVLWCCAGIFVLAQSALVWAILKHRGAGRGPADGSRSGPEGHFVPSASGTPIDRRT